MHPLAIQLYLLLHAVPHCSHLPKVREVEQEDHGLDPYYQLAAILLDPGTQGSLSHPNEGRTSTLWMAGTGVFWWLHLCVNLIFLCQK